MKKLLSNALIVAIITLISQILGYARELIFAYFLGTSSSFEAFQVAETVPLLFTQILISSIPLALTPLIIKDDKDDSLLQNSVYIFTSVMFVLMLLIMFFPHLFVNVIAPGFNGDKFTLTCRLATILAPNILFLSLVSIFTSFLNAKNQFIIPSLAVLSLNSSIILMQLLTKANVLFVAIGSILGSIIAFIIVISVAAIKYQYKPDLSKYNTKKIKIILKALLPVSIISSFTSLNLIFDKNFASQLGDGTVAILSYSYKIIYLPVYIFMTSITKVMLPSVTRLIHEKRYNELTIIIRKIILISLMLGVGIVVVIILCSDYFVNLLFGRGAFNSHDILRTSGALKIYSFGIIGLALNSFFQSISYANGRYYQPLIIYIIQLGLYFIITTILLPIYHIHAIILGNVISVNISIVLWIILIRKKYKLI